MTTLELWGLRLASVEASIRVVYADGRGNYNLLHEVLLSWELRTVP